MKIPEIDPELHGLIDEVVTDPRSALRRTPRRALLQWLGNPDSATARPLDATTAERHLVAVYRESLAEIFRESALVAYYQAPFRSHPRRDVQGRPVPSGPLVDSLRRKICKAEEFGLENAKGPTDIAKLLTQCRTDLPHGPANVWANLSVALAPTDFGRFVAALTLPITEHCQAIGILQRLAMEAREPHRRKDIHSQLAVRMAALGWNGLAREQYDQAALNVPESPAAYIIYGFNLSCFLQDDVTAVRHSRTLELLDGIEEERFVTSIAILTEWAQEQSSADVMRARRTARRISGKLCPPLARIAEVWS